MEKVAVIFLFIVWDNEEIGDMASICWDKENPCSSCTNSLSMKHLASSHCYCTLIKLDPANCSSISTWDNRCLTTTGLTQFQSTPRVFISTCFRQSSSTPHTHQLNC
jgi:hypothetical protein